MGRSARFIPESKDGVLVEVTCRTIGARVLLVPSPDLRRFNEAVVGVMGRALEVSRGTPSGRRDRIDIPFGATTIYRLDAAARSVLAYPNL